MERVSMLRAVLNADNPVVITGHVPANENIALTTIQTLFVRDHNRIVLQSAVAEHETQIYQTRL